MVDFPKIIGSHDGSKEASRLIHAYLQDDNAINVLNSAQKILHILEGAPMVSNLREKHMMVETSIARDSLQLQGWNQEVQERSMQKKKTQTEAMQCTSEVSNLRTQAFEMPAQFQKLEEDKWKFLAEVTNAEKKIDQLIPRLGMLTANLEGLLARNEQRKQERLEMAKLMTEQAMRLRAMSKRAEQLKDTIASLECCNREILRGGFDSKKVLTDDDNAASDTIKGIDACIARVQMAEGEILQHDLLQKDQESLENDGQEVAKEHEEYLNNLQQELHRMERSVFVYLILEIWRSITGSFGRAPTPRALDRDVKPIKA